MNNLNQWERQYLAICFMRVDRKGKGIVDIIYLNFDSN